MEQLSGEDGQRTTGEWWENKGGDRESPPVSFSSGAGNGEKPLVFPHAALAFPNDTRGKRLSTRKDGRFFHVFLSPYYDGFLPF